jgi:hypothetical protein
MRDIIERANLQASMVTKAFQDESLQDDPEALAAWAMQEMGISPDETRMVETLAYKSLMIIEEYQHQRAQAEAARRPQRREPSIKFILVVPPKGDQHFLHDSELASLCLHQTALVGVPIGYLSRSFIVHDDPSCIKMMGDIQGKPAPFKLIGNEGYTPCSGCALPLAGPSLAESLAHPPLPVPHDLAVLFYGGNDLQFQSQARQTRRKKQPAKEQLSLFD